MNKRNDVEVIINGKQYHMGGYESEEYLQKVASYINSKYAEFKKQDGYMSLDAELKNVLMQINLADDYFKLKKNQEETADDSEDKSRELAELKREIITIQTKLDVAELENKALREENLELQKKIIRLETELEEGKKALIQNKPEILAPAGSIESLRAAVAAGADAIYIGGSRFGARAYAESTQNDSLLSAIDYAHTKNRRVYLTVNTLLKEQELTGELYDYIKTYYEGGVDAVIVQDVGVLHFLAAHFPDLPVHASTQMTIVSGDGAAELAGTPVTRVVPARELSFAEVRQLRESTPLEIETFVHGALCYCYSGQCLFSSMIGGRSGNRGRCAQPCRMAYSLWNDGKKVRDNSYMLSPKDMCTLDKIPQLVNAGIDSFKIEGRMKRPEYTAGVTAAYRLLTDLYFEYGEKEFEAYLKKNPDVLAKQMERVSDLYNRGGFTGGYYVHYNGPEMMSMERPNHSGVPVGEVISTKGGRAGIRLNIPVQPQDVLEIRTPSGENYEFTAGKAGLEKKGYYETNVKRDFPLANGLPVYRTKNETLLLELSERYVSHTFQTPVQGQFYAKEGEPARLVLTAYARRKSTLAPHADTRFHPIEVVAEGDVVTAAKSQPVTAEKIKEQLKKTGESEFFFEELSVEAEGNIFLPVGKIKELRRAAFAMLTGEILNGYRRELPESEEFFEKLAADGPAQDRTTHTIPSPASQKNVQSTGVVCLVSTKEQWDAVMETAEVCDVYLDLQNEPLTEQIALARETERLGKQAFLVLPHIFRVKERSRYEQVTNDLKQGGFTGFLVKSLEELAFLKSIDWKAVPELRLNYNLYVYNKEAKQFFNEKQITRFTAPVELNSEELEMLGIEDCDFLIYGRLPLMVSVQCIRKNAAHFCGKNVSHSSGTELVDKQLGCQNGKVTEGLVLLDRMGARFPVRQICASCYNVIYNSACLSLIGQKTDGLQPSAFRLDFTLESAEETKRVLNAFLAGETLLPAAGENYTKGHFKRGIM